MPNFSQIAVVTEEKTCKNVIHTHTCMHTHKSDDDEVSRDKNAYEVKL